MKEYLTKKCQTIAIYSGAMPDSLTIDWRYNKPTGTRLGYCKYSKDGKELLFTCCQPGRMGYMRVSDWFGLGFFQDFEVGLVGSEKSIIVSKIDFKVGETCRIMLCQ